MKKGLKSMLLAGLMAGSLAVTGCELSFNNDSDLEKQQQEIYKLAKEAGFEGTYEEWLDSIKGAKGEKGDAGATWHTGTVAPTDTLGKNGDFYYDSVALKVYHKEDGVWVSKSSLGMKNILKIEKVSSGDEIDVYRVTYTDNTTDEFGVSKDVDLVTATQEELFTEFKTIVANSMAKPYYFADAKYEYISANGDKTTFKGSITTDENGMYSVYVANGQEEQYYVKIDDKYVRFYYDDQIKQSEYVTQEKWEQEKQNIVYILNAPGNIYTNNLLTSESISEMVQNFKINLVNGMNAALPLNPVVEVSKQYDETIQKEKLVVAIESVVEGSVEGDSHISIIFECYDNEFKRMVFTQGRITGSNAGETTIYSIDIEYFTNNNLVKDKAYFENMFPTPSEVE